MCEYDRALLNALRCLFCDVVRCLTRLGLLRMCSPYLSWANTLPAKLPVMFVIGAPVFISAIFLFLLLIFSFCVSRGTSCFCSF